MLTQQTRPGHVLYLDLVGMSSESINAQSRLLSRLADHLGRCPSYIDCQAAGVIDEFQTGDGMAVLFTGVITQVAKCAVELASELKGDPSLGVRIGIHSGPVQLQVDSTGTPTATGEGIETAKRVMRLGDDGYILASDESVKLLWEYPLWSQSIFSVGLFLNRGNIRMPVHCIVHKGVGRAEPIGSLSDQASSDEPLANTQTKTTKEIDLTSPEELKPYSVASAEDPDTPRIISRRGALTDKVSIFSSQAGEVPGQNLSIVLLYRRNLELDDQLLALLESELKNAGHTVFIDRHMKIGVDWAKTIESKIRAADAVIALLSDNSILSEMIQYEVEIASDERCRRGKPFLLPVRIGSDTVVGEPIGAYVNSLHFAVWHGPQDNARTLREIRSALVSPPSDDPVPVKFEPVGGAVPPDSPYYVERSSDVDFHQALEANESIILIKGPRQVGKTSLIGRGIMACENNGWRLVSTDFQKTNASLLQSESAFYKSLAASLARELNFKYDFTNDWMDVFAANTNLDNFMRELLKSSDRPLIWFMDEADRLFSAPFANDFFGLIRSWHNSRATDRKGPWGRFTVVVSYATEAHLFIRDLNQSPFNVGRSIELHGFSTEQVADLNQRYGGPIKSTGQLFGLTELVAGQPALIRRTLDLLARGQIDMPELIETADKDSGPFADHLKRMLLAVSQLTPVWDELRKSLVSPDLVESEGLLRLVASGILIKTPENRYELSCALYRDYLEQHVR